MLNNISIKMRNTFRDRLYLLWRPGKLRQRWSFDADTLTITDVKLGGTLQLEKIDLNADQIDIAQAVHRAPLRFLCVFGGCDFRIRVDRDAVPDKPGLDRCPQLHEIWQIKYPKDLNAWLELNSRNHRSVEELWTKLDQIVVEGIRNWPGELSIGSKPTYLMIRGAYVAGTWEPFICRLVGIGPYGPPKNWIADLLSSWALEGPSSDHKLSSTSWQIETTKIGFSSNDWLQLKNSSSHAAFRYGGTQPLGPDNHRYHNLIYRNDRMRLLLIFDVLMAFEIVGWVFDFKRAGEFYRPGIRRFFLFYFLFATFGIAIDPNHWVKILFFTGFAVAACEIIGTRLFGRPPQKRYAPYDWCRSAYEGALNGLLVWPNTRRAVPTPQILLISWEHDDGSFYCLIGFPRDLIMWLQTSGKEPWLGPLSLGAASTTKNDA